MSNDTKKLAANDQALENKEIALEDLEEVAGGIIVTAESPKGWKISVSTRSTKGAPSAEAI